MDIKAGIALAALLACLLVAASPVPAQALQNLTVKLSFNHSDNLVYVPVWGERTKTLPYTYQWGNPLDWYLASYLNGAVYGIVFMEDAPTLLDLRSTQTSHSIAMTQGFNGSRAALVFSRGDWKTIDERMDLIRSGRFMEEVSPTFGFGFGVHHPIKMVLEYTALDLVGDLILRLGNYDLVFEYNQTVSGIPQIVVSSA